MNVLLVTKRKYTNKDLVADRFGRLYHLPYQWSLRGARVTIVAMDYDAPSPGERLVSGNLSLQTIPGRGFSSERITQCLSGESFDIVVASGHVHLARLGLLLAEQYQARSVLDLYDYYPAFIRPLRQLLRWYLARLIQRFDGVMAVSKRLAAWAGENNPSVCRIPNGVDVGLFQAKPMASARRQCGLVEAKRYLGLFGSVSADLGLLEVLGVLKKLRASNPEVELIMAGQGGEAVAEVDGVRYLGLLSQESIIEWASACDCLLIPYRESLQVYYSQSARMSEYMALQKPIVVTRCGDAPVWFPSDFPGWCEPADTESMYRAVKAQLTNPTVVPLPDELHWSSAGAASYDFLLSIMNRDK